MATYCEESDDYTSSPVHTSQKLKGVCSVCRSLRQLHNIDGKVHLHGPRKQPCPGSHRLPLGASCSQVDRQEEDEHCQTDETSIDTQTNVSKASGVCSRCMTVRQLHLKDGTVHLHGPRNNPCPGSRQPPLSSTSAGGTQGTEVPQLDGRVTAGSAQLDPTNGASRPVNTTHASCENDALQHPRQQGRRILKHIPKGARFACSKALTAILHTICNKPERVESWRKLLWFAANILEQPQRAGRRRNLANIVKKRLDGQDFHRTYDVVDKSSDSGYQSKARNAKDVVLAAVNSKLEEGNIRAATRILCSRDFPVKATNETLALIQEKHPSDAWSANLALLPNAADTTPIQFTEKDVVEAVRSFPVGSSGGPDGMRPQHLLDLLKNREYSEELRQALTGFVNTMLKGECPQEIRSLMFGGSLIALSKKTGGLRPIAIGYVWRRLAAKCANKHAVSKLAPLFSPIQVGIATPGGAEASVHAARAFVSNMTEDQIFVKLDFANAFNTMRRDVMLQAVYDTILELYAFVHQAYSAESLLQFGTFEVRSQVGPQQGDPLGPLLFCLPLQPYLRTMEADFRLGFLDDISLGGKTDSVRHDLATIADLEQSLGIHLNRHKCEYFSYVERSEDFLAGFQRVERESLTLLGAPMFRGKALDRALEVHSNTLEMALNDLTCLGAQGALMLLRSCFGAPKLTYLLRSAPCWGHPLLEKIDTQMRHGLQKILNIELNDIQWLQATLPIRDGGLGVRRVTMLASSAFLASAASTKTLGMAILDREELLDDYENEILEARSSTLPGEASARSKQKSWDKPLIDQDRALVWSVNSDPLNRARLGAISAPHAGDWLSTVPVASCGLGLSNEAIRVAVGLRLGLKLCAPHQCQCGGTADPGGHHGLVCKKSEGRSSRHFAMNDIIWRSLKRADIPSSKEPPGLLRSDGKRPDGATLIPWAGGKYLTWDATSIHSCAASYLPKTSMIPGSAAELAASRKIAKYAELPATHDFVPIALETLGPINLSGREFLMELGRRLSDTTGDPMEPMYLFQRLSICTQRHNAIAFRGTFMHDIGGEDQEPYA